MTRVFDSGAILAWMRDEPGATLVEAALHDAGSTRAIHVLNLAEVFYDQRRIGGEEFAQTSLDTLILLGMDVREDLDALFWQDAGRIKADFARISLADCCELALTCRLGGTFLTTDRHEMDRDEIKALCDIEFIR